MQIIDVVSPADALRSVEGKELRERWIVEQKKLPKTGKKLFAVQSKASRSKLFPSTVRSLTWIVTARVTNVKLLPFPLLQDEKNQLLVTNIWLKLVSSSHVPPVRDAFNKLHRR
jgi:hypothetical protein